MSDQPIISGPGKYRTVRFDETGEQRHLADVEAFGNGRWYGSVAVPDLAYAWTPDGNCVANEKVCITGPYVEPPKPVSLRKSLGDEAKLLRDWINALSYSGSFSGNAAEHLNQLADRLDELAAKAT